MCAVSELLLPPQPAMAAAARAEATIRYRDGIRKRLSVAVVVRCRQVGALQHAATPGSLAVATIVRG